MSLRVVFMGTPDFSVPTLMEIIGQGHEVVACYTQPPRPAGRGMEERPSPVEVKAEAFHIPVYTPRTLKSPIERESFLSHEADVAVVVAYGLILPRDVLIAPVHGCLNLHASLLPRWRGAAPINRAIMAGDTETGVEVMRMEEGLDTGPVCMAEKMAIGPDMTAGELHDALSRLGADLVGRALAALSRGALGAEPQSQEGVTYASKISKDETRIDWSRPAAEVHNHIRGLSPFPGAWCEVPRGENTERVKVLRSTAAAGSGKPGEVLDAMTIACGEGAVRLTQVQRAGKRPMDAQEFLRGSRIEPGTILP
ncbi:methionyl-tRNA formyltransferase [Breoghania corrubedonensis]|uniref:Methionyl-tRNA formyltransferase n=1 Tax=Breoghania corrubedonensis TaxID=665038 RepID=A0A2T5VFY9_9HYPH|nr:methionyl-tRNA formyltransferase [Breoghania corrubedonensis]PTW62671.1 methionyl-tRNA formyltransferase [Breoghania corrubedonensis]